MAAVGHHLQESGQYSHCSNIFRLGLNEVRFNFNFLWLFLLNGCLIFYLLFRKYSFLKALLKFILNLIKLIE